ncbi:MAG TPA: OsmC family protein [Rhodothermales bacterium]|nr:OsmC family protein [Rhodothermales bacterium]
MSDALTPADVSSAAPRPFESDGVQVRIGTGLRVDVEARGHILIADEPASVGGTEAGPTPYDFVVAALGACTAMTLRLYANRKGWPLDGVDVHLTHARVHAADCEACEKVPTGMDEVTRTVTLHGPLTDAQRARLLEMADKCPVHQSLERGLRVVTRAA